MGDAESRRLQRTARLRAARGLEENTELGSPWAIVHPRQEGASRRAAKVSAALRKSRMRMSAAGKSGGKENLVETLPRAPPIDPVEAAKNAAFEAITAGATPKEAAIRASLASRASYRAARLRPDAALTPPPPPPRPTVDFRSPPLSSCLIRHPPPSNAGAKARQELSRRDRSRAQTWAEKHRNDTIPCDYCGVSFTSRDELAQHNMACGNADSGYPCTSCKAIFAGWPNFVNHHTHAGENHIP